MMQSSYQIFLYVRPKDIAYLNKIFEGYENLALVTTMDNKAGLVRLNTTPDTKEDVLKIVKELSRTIEITFHN